MQHLSDGDTNSNLYVWRGLQLEIRQIETIIVKID